MARRRAGRDGPHPARPRRRAGRTDRSRNGQAAGRRAGRDGTGGADLRLFRGRRSEEHTSELQSLMRISYADFCLKKKKPQSKNTHAHQKHYSSSILNTTELTSTLHTYNNMI